MQEAGRVRDPAYLVYRWLWESLDWLYPPHCGGCGEPGSRWCARCQESVTIIQPPLCRVCGQPVRIHTTQLCAACRNQRPAYTALRSWAAFIGPLREALHRLKYKKDIALGEILSRDLIHWYQSLGWNAELVVPVPLSKSKMIQRGYNQVAYLARPFAMGLGLAYQPRGMARLRETRSQVGLNREERQDNVSGAFMAKPDLVRGKVILLMDDTATTGATLDECARVLMEAGAREVYAVTAARAVQM